MVKVVYYYKVDTTDVNASYGTPEPFCIAGRLLKRIRDTLIPEKSLGRLIALLIPFKAIRLFRISWTRHKEGW